MQKNEYNELKNELLNQQKNELHAIKCLNHLFILFELPGFIHSDRDPPL